MNDGLQKDYQAVMDHLYVDDDMYSRVLQKVTENVANRMDRQRSGTVKSGSGTKRTTRRKKINRSHRKTYDRILRFAPVIAAAAAVLIVLAVIPGTLRPKLTQEESGTNITVAEQNGVTEKSTVSSDQGISAKSKESSGDDMGSACTQVADAETGTGADAGSVTDQADTAAESSINNGLASAESAEESVADSIAESASAADQETASKNKDDFQDAAADADGTPYQEARTYSAEITDLHTRISEAMGKGLLPFVVSCGIYENPDRVVVTVTTRDEASIKLLESYNTGNVQMEIQYTDSAANAE